MMGSPQCYITSFVEMGPLVPVKKMKGFTIYGGHLGHVTIIMLINFHFHVPKSLHTNFVKMAQWFLRKSSFNFHM